MSVLSRRGVGRACSEHHDRAVGALAAWRRWARAEPVAWLEHHDKHAYRVAANNGAADAKNINGKISTPDRLTDRVVRVRALASAAPGVDLRRSASNSFPTISPARTLRF